MSNSGAEDYFDIRAIEFVKSLQPLVDINSGGDGVEVMLNSLNNSRINSVGYEYGEFFIKFDDTFIYLYDSGDYFIKWDYFSVSGVYSDGSILDKALKIFGYSKVN